MASTLTTWTCKTSVNENIHHARKMGKTANAHDFHDTHDTCDTCGTKRTTTITILGISRKVPCVCRCQAEAQALRKRDEQRREIIRRIEKLKKYSLMDARFRNSTLAAWNDDVGCPKLKKTILRYVEAWPEMKTCNIGLMLLGNPGVGKSFAAFAVANELISRHREVVIAVSAMGLLARIRETFNRQDREAEIDIIRTLENASLLVLDDLGSEQKTDWATAMLYQIIDNRYRSGKPLLITTNLSLQQLQQKLTGYDQVVRTYDRLMEMCQPITVKGPSQRAAVARSKRDQLIQLITSET
ncbi:ATP-binding protein [Anoxynatronum buryatiense]|uniref:Phage DNA replication protein (Predicted replicative helicase loader) n=1 Tax=Anoxynatronum buryatiense TaxID=489973 RepID=A0AA45WSK3_9CLOT|nr:ATP-binding protein [Anoxynatronum buryatiense]SMP38323.1 phage DNA replication protein (predicted replicative helicase loader) [Anoxynatronum buryatiense]